MPGFDTTISIGNLLIAASIGIATIGLIISTIFGIRENKRHRAERVLTIFNELKSDPRIMEILSIIMSKQFKFDESFIGSVIEVELHMLLGSFDNVAQLYFYNVVDLEDLQTITWEFLVIYRSEAVQEYLNYLDNRKPEHKINFKLYDSFRELSKLLEEKYGLE